MARYNILGRSKADPTQEAAQSTLDNAKDTALLAFANVKDAAQSTYNATQNNTPSYSDIQANVQDKVGKAQDVITAGTVAARGLFKANAKKTNKNLKKAQNQLGDLQGTVQDKLGGVQDTVQTAVTTGLSKAQDVISGTVDTAQDVFEKNTRAARKNFKKAQKEALKNFKKAQKSAKSNIAATVSTAQDVTDMASKKANAGFLQSKSAAQDAVDNASKKATASFLGAKSTVQDKLDDAQAESERKARRKANAKGLFRFGLVAGIVIALLYTPTPGSQVRQQLMQQVNKYREQFGF
ncbi:MAG: hypothetical protein NVS9B9_23610 [Ktedonobacteraceae bacterium]